MPEESRSSSTHALGRIDPASLIGAWVNTEPSPRGVARVFIERRGEALGISTLGAGDQALEDWGWTHADAVYAASAAAHDAVAFTAVHTVESRSIVLQANMSKGLLIVSSIQTRLDSGDTEARFSREFFYKADPEAQNAPEVQSTRSAARSVPPSISASSFVGAWRNTNLEGSGIASVSFEPTAAGATMRISGRHERGLHDWGTTAVEVYSEIGATSDPGRIKARYDLGSIDLLLHGWVKQGVLVLALFRRFTDESGKSNYFDREFFYRTNGPL
jgi:hypothetical protein